MLNNSSGPLVCSLHWLTSHCIILQRSDTVSVVT